MNVSMYDLVFWFWYIDINLHYYKQPCFFIVLRQAGGAKMAFVSSVTWAQREALATQAENNNRNGVHHGRLSWLVNLPPHNVPPPPPEEIKVQ